MYKKQDAEVEDYTRELLRQDLSDIEKFSKLKLSLKISFHIRDELREELASRLKDEEEGEKNEAFYSSGLNNYFVNLVNYIYF